MVPVVVLVVIAIPSFKLLYDQNTIPEADLTIKAIGNTWFWDYEYPDEGLAFSAYMVAEEDLARRFEDAAPGLGLLLRPPARHSLAAGDLLSRAAEVAHETGSDAA